MNNNILILDYKVGNVNSVIKAVKYLNYNPILSNKIKDIQNCKKIILPGQGSFDYAMKNLGTKAKDELLNQAKKGKPILGICLGMQILASYGYENDKKTQGLDLIKGKVIKFKSKKIKLPHIGWSTVSQIKKDEIFLNIPQKTDFYHCHSYIFKTSNNSDVLAQSNYGEKFATIIKKENILGVQFHPEKSLKFGIKLIENFLQN